MSLITLKRTTRGTVKTSVRRKIATALALSAPLISQFSVLSSSSQGASAAWTGGTDSNWSTVTNWTPLPVTVPGVGDTATFNGPLGIGGGVISTNNISLGALIFDTANAAGYTIGGATAGTGQITFADGTTTAISMTSTVTQNELVNTNLILGTAIASNTTFTNASVGSTLTIAGNITGGTGGTAAAKVITLTGAGAIALTGAVTKGGATTLTLQENNTGTVTLSNSNSLYTSILFNGGGSSSILDIGAGILKVNNGGSTGIQTQGTTSATINASAGGSIALQAADGDWGAANGTTLTINALITGAFRYENFVVANGTGVTVLGNVNNSFTGGLLISSSIVSVAGIGNTGFNSYLGTGSTLSLGNGTLRYTGTGEQTNKILALTSTNTAIGIDNSGTGVLEFTNTAAYAAGAGSKTFTLSGSTAGVGILDGILADNSATNKTSLSKTGTGTWALTGLNTYTGTTSITGGNLVVTRATGLGVGGAVTLNNAGLIYQASSDAALALTSTLAITGGANATIGGSIGSTTTSAQINVTGAATATAAALKVNVYGVSGVSPATGTYTLLHGGAGSTLNNFTTLTLGTVLNNTNWTVGALSKTATDIQVGITSVAGLTTAFWNGGFAGGTNVWAISNGTANSNWVTAAGGGATALVPGTTTDVTISATTPTLAPTSTILGANMSIKSLTISDTTNGLRITNDGNALTIGTGGITVAASVPLATLANVTAGAAQTWTNNSTTPLVIAGSLGGSGNIAKAGTGVLTLAGTGGNYAGTLSFTTASTLNLNGPQALGATGTLTIGITGVTIDNTSGQAVSLTGANPINLNQPFTFPGGAGTTHDLTFGSGTTTVAAAASTVTVGGATSTLGFGGTFALGANALTKAGVGNLSLNGVVTGTVANGSTSVTVNAGTLSFTGVNSSFSGNIVVSGATSVLQMAGSNGSATGAPLGYIVGGTTTPGYKTVTLQNGGIFRPLASYNDNAPTTALPGNGYIFIMGTGGGVFDVPNGVTLTIDDGSGTGTGTGNNQLQGSGTLTKTGLGILAQDDSILYAGAIDVLAGTLQAASANAFGASSAGTTIRSGAALNVNGQTMTNAEPVTLFGTGLAASPAGALTNVSGTAATYVGPVTIGAGGATIGSSSGTLNVTGAIGLGANTLTIQQPAGRIAISGGISGTGAVVINSSGTGDYVPSGVNTYSGGTTINAGATIALSVSSLGTVGSITSGPFGTGALVLNGGQMRSGTGGTFTVLNPVTVNGDFGFYTIAGERSLIMLGAMTLTGSRTFTSAAGTTVAGTQVFLNGNIGETGGPASLTKAGAGNLTLGGINSYTGGTIVTGGNLFLSGSLANNTPLTVGSGTLFSLVSNANNPIASLSTLSVAAATLGFDLGNGQANSDSIAVTGAATTSGAITLNLNSLAGLSAGTYNLITATGGLDTATYTLGTVPGGFTYALNTSPSLVSITLTGAAGGNLYWRGGVNNSWSALSAGLTNFTTDAPGLTNAGFNPGPSNSVIFSATSAVAPTIATTLDSNVFINDLQFASAPTGVSAITIANGNLGTNTLTIAPSSPTAGITMAQGAGAATISAPIALGAPQTWSVDSSTPGSGTASSLTISGPISGGSANTLTLSSIAGTTPITFAAAGSTYSGNTIVSAGAIVQGGATNGFSPNSALIVNGTFQTSTAATGFSQSVGSLIGGNGIIQNGHASTATTLTIGGDNVGTLATPATFGGTIQNGGVGTLGITKAGTGVQLLTGTNTYTGATTVNGGVLQLGGTNAATAVVVNTGATLQTLIPNALTAVNNVTLTGTGTLDLFGNSVTIGSLTSAATSIVTNSSTSTAASTATTPGTPSGVGIYVDALTVNTALTANINALINDGPTRKVQLIVNNGNAGIGNLNTAGSTFSGGIVLTNSVAGTRLDVTSAPIALNYGTGPIIVGQAATDKAGIYLPVAVTITNPVVFNTALGTDRVGMRVDAASTFSGVVTANLAPVTVTSNTATGSSATFTNQITGPNGFVVDITSLSAAATSFNVVLNNQTVNPNNYQGDTIVNLNPATGKSATLTLGASNQLPDGSSTGNIVLNTNGTGVGLLNLAGFSDTINGLNGNGTVDATTGTSTLTLGGNNATAAFSGVLQNSTTSILNVVKTGTGTQTLSGASTFTGSLTVNNGLIAFATSPANTGPLGNTTAVTLSGGGISYTGTVSNNLNRPIAIGAADGTVNVSSSLGALTIPSVTSTGGNLIKTGPGLALITAGTTLNSGNSGVIVTGGTLQGGFGTSGIGSINIGSSGNLSFLNNAAEVLTLGGPGTLTLASGAKLGFELGITGVNDEIIYNTASSAGNVTLNLFNIGSLTGTRTYTLLTSSVLNGLASTNFVLGSAPTGFNYSILNDGTTVTLTATDATGIYWRGGADLSWNTLGAAPANWTTDAAGLTDSTHTPIAGETVIFSATGAPNVGTTLTTTLDASFTIDSLQFVTPIATTTLTTINQGSTGTITLKPASASGGLLIAGGAGSATITAPVILDNTLSTSQAWNVTDSGSTLTLTGNVTFGANVVKGGLGALTLSGNNSGSGSITLSAGTLNVNSATALGGGTLNIAAGTTLNNTSGAAIAMTANNPVNVTGDFTFTGSNSLNFGTGAATISNGPTIAVSANTLTLGGVVGGSGGFTKTGAGTLVLSGNNTYSGLTTVSAGSLNLLGANTGTGGVAVSGGTLNLGNAAAVGTGALTINSGSIDNISGAAMTLANNPLVINGGFTFVGTDNLSLGTGPISVTATPTITTTAKILTLANNIGGTFGLTKTGAGTLTLSGANTYTGPTVVNAGTLNVTGSMNSLLLGNITAAGGGAVLNVSGSITGGGTVSTGSVLAFGNATGNSTVNVTGNITNLYTFTGANAGTPATVAAVYNQTAGTVNFTTTAVANVTNYLSTTGYGYMNVTGGTLVAKGRFAPSNGTGAGVIYVGGTGTIDTTGGEWLLMSYSASGNGGLSSITVAPGGQLLHAGASNNFGLNMDRTGSYAVLNVAGGLVTTSTTTLTFGNGATAINGTSGYLNLAGGTLTMGKPIGNGNTGGTGNNAYINLAGGTIQANASITGLIPVTAANQTFTTTVFGPIDNSALLGNTSQNFGGGVTIDTSTFTVTSANNFVGASGAGVTQADLVATGGSGYIGAPHVQFSTAGVVAGGTPAQGYALISGGQVTGIVITDPGTYTAGTTPTITLTGGGGTGASVTVGALNTLNSNVGGLTKLGTGNLTLSGASSYGGPTVISAGTLQLGAAGTTGSLSTGSLISIASGANLTFNRTNAVTQGTDFANGISGAGSVIQSGTAALTLGGVNTYTGGTTINGGVGGLISVTSNTAVGTGNVNLNSTNTGPGITFQLNGNGLNFTNPIIMNATTGREGIQSVGGNNTLSSPITSNAAIAAANTLVIDSGTAGNTFTVAGPITADPLFTGGVSLRGSSLGTTLGVLASTAIINTPNSALDHNVGGIWTINSTGNIYSVTQLNGTVAGTGLQLGVNDALNTAAKVFFGAASTDFLDLNGKNQTVAGLDLATTTGNPSIGSSSTSTASLLTVNPGATVYTYAGKIVDSLTVNSIVGTQQVALTIGTGKQILTGANTYTGTTTINAAGILQLGNAGATGTLAPASTIIDNGSFIISRTGTVTQGVDFSTAAITGTGNLVLAATPTVVLTADNTYAGGTTIVTGSTLQVGNGGTAGLFGTGPVANAGLLTFNKTSNTPLTATNLVTGTGAVTLTNTGAVTAAADNQFNVSGALTIGASAGATGLIGNLDLTNGSSTFGALTVLTNNAGSTILVGPGKTLTNNGNVTIGYATPLVANSLAKLTITGGGNYAMTGTTFQVGGGTVAGPASLNSVLDLSGLASANINITGTFRVNQPNGTNVSGNQASLLLPAPITGITPTTPVTTITAASFNVGDNGGNFGSAGQTNSVTLGTGLTTLNVNTINVGTGGRDMGQITVAPGNGTIKIRAADGVSAVAVNIGTGTATTGVSAGTGVTNNVDFSGHSADLLISTLNIGTQSRSNSYANSFSFDTGNLSITSLTAATRTTETAANGVGQPRTTDVTVNFGGGTVNIANGILQFADVAGNYTAAGQTGTENATLNISGGSVSIGATSGVSITMARVANGTSTQATAANAIINLSGGITTMAGDLIKVGASGTGTGSKTASAALNITGGTLDMTGRNVGTASVIIDTFTYSSGSVKDLGTVFGGIAMGGTGARDFNQTGSQAGEIKGAVTGALIGLNKLGTGALTLSGTNTYSGPTSVSAGILLVNGAIASSATTVASGGTLSGAGTTSTVSVLSGGNLSGGATFASIAGVLTTGNLGLASGANLKVEIGGLTPGNGLDKYDQLIVNGTIDLNTDVAAGGSLVVNLINGYAPNIGDTYYLALNDGTDPVANTFAGLPEGSTVVAGDASFILTYVANGDAGSVANDIALVTAVPEPTSLSLLGLAGIGLLSRRRRRSQGR